MSALPKLHEIDDTKIPQKFLIQQAANDAPRAVYVNSARFVTIELAAAITGLTESAVRKRLERGIWLEKKQWRRANDGRIWIDMKGVEQWVEMA